MLFSLFTFGMAYDSPMGRQIGGADVNWKKALKEGWMSAVRQGRSFGAVGSSYAVCECIIESVSILQLPGKYRTSADRRSASYIQYRGKHDMTSAVTGGFAAGAFLARNGGYRAMVLSGATFSAFSYGIEKLWIRKPPANEDDGFFVC